MPTGERGSGAGFPRSRKSAPERPPVGQASFGWNSRDSELTQ